PGLATRPQPGQTAEATLDCPTSQEPCSRDGVRPPEITKADNHEIGGEYPYDQVDLMRANGSLLAGLGVAGIPADERGPYSPAIPGRDDVNGDEVSEVEFVPLDAGE